jgi:hypothetical protein
VTVTVTRPWDKLPTIEDIEQLERFGRPDPVARDDDLAQIEAGLALEATSSRLYPPSCDTRPDERPGVQT